MMKYPNLRHVITRRKFSTKHNHPKTHHLVIPLTSPETSSKITAFRDFLIKNGREARVYPDLFPPLSSMLALRLGNFNLKDAPSQMFTRRAAEDSDDPIFSFTEIMRLLQGLKDPVRQLIKEAGLTDILTVELGKLQPLIFRSTPSPIHVLQILPISNKTTVLLDEISRLVHTRFTAARCFTPDTSRPRNVITFLNTARRLYSDEKRNKPVKREQINLKHLYSLDGMSQFLSQGSAFPKSTLQPVRFDLGKVNVTGIKIQRAFSDLSSEAVYDGELRFSEVDDYEQS